MTICYFGIYKSDFSRNRIYMEGLRAMGVKVYECVNHTRGIRKWFFLWRWLGTLEGNYDAIIVGYPGHIAVPFAKLFSKKPVIADLLGSLYDAEKNSHSTNAWKLLKARIIDFWAVKCADIILLESEAQKKYFEGWFGPSEKYRVLYTGSDLQSTASYAPNPSRFDVIFRGSLTPECGITYILSAAELLRHDPRIQFKIVGRGKLLDDTKQIIETKNLTNVSLVTEYFTGEEFKKQYDGVSLALGQFEKNPRLSRTIPHKTYEALALGIPYLTGAGEAVGEIIKEGETGFVVPLASADALAQKIEELSKDPALLMKVSKNGQKIFNEQCTPEILAGRMVLAINS